MIEGITRNKVTSLIHNIITPLHLQNFIELLGGMVEGRKAQRFIGIDPCTQRSLQSSEMTNASSKNKS